jgi:hypothetical protein
MKSKIFSIGFIFSFLVLCSCEKDKTREQDNFLISYVKGSAWTDYSYHAMIDQDGLLQISEKNGLTKRNRNSAYSLDAVDLTLLKEKLDHVVTIDISDQYGFDNGQAPTDLPVTKLIYSTSNKSDSASIYYPEENELPVPFEALMQTVEQIIIDKDTLLKH